MNPANKESTVAEEDWKGKGLNWKLGARSQKLGHKK
jgi:hypothetical protein